MDETVTTIHVTKVLTTLTIIDLFEEYPNLREITCAPSVYNRISKKYISVLEEVGITVKKKYNWGAKSKTNGLEFEVLDLSKQGLKPGEISEKLGITRNRVYYLLRKAKGKFDNRKRKYNYEEVRALKADGLTAKEISQKKSIPLRTVYYILNNK